MSCSSHYVVVPPAVDLLAVEPIGLITFTVNNAEGDLDEMATQVFLRELTAFQKVPVLELGKFQAVLDKAGQSGLGPEAARAIAEHFKIKSFFYGEIQVSKVKHQVDLTGVLHGNLRARASMTIAVTARLMAGETGATLWTNSAVVNGTVGVLSLSADQVPRFGIKDKDEETMNMLSDLMFRLTWDFRPTRERL